MEALFSPYNVPSSIPSTAALWRGRRAGLGAVAFARRRGDGLGGAESGGRLVDEGMVVLRRRLREMKMAERNYEAPPDWAEWEKRCYASYGAGVCRLAGMVQVALMSTRPSVALGVLALLALSVPTSAATVLLALGDAAGAVLASARLG